VGRKAAHEYVLGQNGPLFEYFLLAITIRTRADTWPSKTALPYSKNPKLHRASHKHRIVEATTPVNRLLSRSIEKSSRCLTAYSASVGYVVGHNAIVKNGLSAKGEASSPGFVSDEILDQRSPELTGPKFGLPQKCAGGEE